MACARFESEAIHHAPRTVRAWTEERVVMSGQAKSCFIRDGAKVRDDGDDLYRCPTCGKAVGVFDVIPESRCPQPSPPSGDPPRACRRA